MKVQMITEHEVSWDTVVNNIRLGRRYPIGTKFTDTLKDGREFTVILVHWNSEKDEAVFAFERCPFRCTMNKSGTNKAGYHDSEVRQELKAFFEQLPERLQNVIKKKKIVEVIDGNKIKMKDKLFIPSEFQVFGEEICGKRGNNDKEQFEYFKEPINRVCRVDDEENACYWWERSPLAGYTTHYCVVMIAGDASYNNASVNSGVLPCFVIR